MPNSEIALPDGYGPFLESLKRRVREARIQAQRTVNTQLIELYWHLGREILQRQQAEGWGSGVVGRIAEDLAGEFRDMTGLSRTNLLYMRAFAAAWPPETFVPQAVGHMPVPNVPQLVGQLPWGHIRLLIDRLDTREERDRYAAAAVEHGWSRNLLLNHLKNRTLERTGTGPSNFARALPAPEAESARQLSKDPYNLEFLGLTAASAERDLEQALTDRIVETLRELGPGFCFVGRQVHLEVDDDDYFIDLLFFNLEQRRYVVFELKTGKFQPEFAGKLNFYIALVDDQLRRDYMAPSIGILVCGSKNDRTVRYVLDRTSSPMAVSEYTYEALPEPEKAALPAAAELVAAFDWADPSHTENGE